MENREKRQTILEVLWLILTIVVFVAGFKAYGRYKDKKIDDAVGSYYKEMKANEQVISGFNGVDSATVSITFEKRNITKKTGVFNNYVTVTAYLEPEFNELDSETQQQTLLTLEDMITAVYDDTWENSDFYAYAKKGFKKDSALSMKYDGMDMAVVSNLVIKYSCQDREIRIQGR